MNIPFTRLKELRLLSVVPRIPIVSTTFRICCGIDRLHWLGVLLWLEPHIDVADAQTLLGCVGVLH